MFLIALALTAAGFLVCTLCVPATTTAADADAVEPKASSANALKTMTPEIVAVENQDVDPLVLDEQASETNENAVDETPVPMDSDQCILDKQKQQFLSRQVFFAFNSCLLDEQARTIVREQAEWLGGNPEVRVEIIGYCDQSGSPAYNMALGKKRANAVKTSLENLGIEPRRLIEVSYGETSPVHTVHTTTDQDAARINRRVEFKIQPAA